MRIFAVLLLLITQSVTAQPSFERGNDFYRSGNFKSAAAEYENLLKSGKESAELYHNLANAYYKMNRLGHSIYFYEKALLLDPNDIDTKTNLEFARKKRIDEIKEVPRSGLSSIIRDLTSVFHYNTWAWTTVAAAFLLLLCFAAYYFSMAAHRKKVWFGVMFFPLVLMVVSVFAAFVGYNSFSSERPAIVLSGVAEVKSEPSELAEAAFVLHEGTKVYVEESLGKWSKVWLPDGNNGWLRTANIRELKD
ncbi:MAG TPA: tetratricopeptide repeat protein [Flavobacterium sp.]|jgi:tetratricopeptide (TPR) repeat protein